MSIIEALGNDELESMKVRWVVGGVEINNSGTTNFEEVVEEINDKEETIRKPLKGQTGQETWRHESSWKGEFKGRGICEFMYSVNVAIRR